MMKSIILAVLAIFGVLTFYALAQDGIHGVFAAISHNWMSVQIFADLVIALTLVMVWMWRDVKAKGRNPWPWIVATLLIGSFAPLVYLLTRQSTQTKV